MNHEQANAVKDLAPRVIEVLEKLEVECPECRGRGESVGKESSCGGMCITCNGTGKIHYSWTPQVGEWIRYKLGNGITIRLIRQVTSQNKLLLEPATLYLLDAYSKGVTPILEWEEIEKVLEKVGYVLWESYSSRGRYTAGINDKDGSFGDSRQEAVMKAVLELEKR